MSAKWRRLTDLCLSKDIVALRGSFLSDRTGNSKISVV